MSSASNGVDDERARLGEQRGAFFHVAECINNRDGDAYRTTGGVAELDSDADGRTTFNNDGAVCSAKEGKGEGNRARSPLAYLPPSLPPTRNAAHLEEWSCGQSPERGRAVLLLFGGF